MKIGNLLPHLMAEFHYENPQKLSTFHEFLNLLTILVLMVSYQMVSDEKEIRYLWQVNNENFSKIKCENCIEVASIKTFTQSQFQNHK